MRLHVVGSSGTYPAPGRPASGFVVTQGATRVWCEAGPGTFTSLPVDPDMIDTVVVSHQHPDHCSDLATAFHAWTYRPEPRRGVPLYAPAAVWDRIGMFLEKGPGSALYDTFEFRGVGDGDTVTIGDLTVRFVEMDHPVPTLGSRWEGHNRTLFFTADTGPGGDWRREAGDVDVMLCEATFQGSKADKPVPHHLTAGEAGTIAREVGASRLVLTHLPPFIDPSRSVHEAELVFDRPVSFATPGMSIDI